MDDTSDLGDSVDTETPNSGIIPAICFSIAGGISTWWFALQIMGNHTEHKVLFLFFMFPTIFMFVAGTSIILMTIANLFYEGPLVEEEQEEAST